MHNIVVTAHARSRRHPHQPVQCYTLALPSREKAFASAPSRTVLPPGPWHGRTNGSDRYTPHQHGQQQRGDQLQRRTRLKAFQMVPEEKRSFFEFSLCFSRVCLGKMFGFIYKWLKKTGFYSPYDALDLSTGKLLSNRQRSGPNLSIQCLLPSQQSSAQPQYVSCSN